MFQKLSISILIHIRHLFGEIVTFTDGSDMYIHLEVLYIAVMLGIVQKEENKSCQRCLKSISVRPRS